MYGLKTNFYDSHVLQLTVAEYFKRLILPSCEAIKKVGNVGNIVASMAFSWNQRQWNTKCGLICSDRLHFFKTWDFACFSFGLTFRHTSILFYGLCTRTKAAMPRGPSDRAAQQVLEGGKARWPFWLLSASYGVASHHWFYLLIQEAFQLLLGPFYLKKLTSPS